MTKEKKSIDYIFKILKVLKYNDIEIDLLKSQFKAINFAGEKRIFKIEFLNKIKTVIVIANLDRMDELNKYKTFCIKTCYKSNKFILFDYL